MTLKNEFSDLASFLPYYWFSMLQNVPILGQRYEIIDLDISFIEFLESDGISLDEDRPFTSGFSSSDEDYPDNQSDSSAKYFKPSDIFPETHEKIKLSLQSLGGSVVPKLNWTVPKVKIYPMRFSLYFVGLYLDFCQYT